MRQLLFITIMGAILTPLSAFQTEDPFRNLGRMPSEFEGVEAIQILSKEAQRLYTRAETTMSQQLNELAREWFD